MFKIPSKHQQTAIDIAASAAQFKEKANDGIARRFAGVLGPGETSPDFLFAQELIGRLLGDVYENLKQAGQRANQPTGRRRHSTRAARPRRRRAAHPPALRKAAARQITRSRDRQNRARGPPIFQHGPSMLVQSARDVITALRNRELGLEGKPSVIFDTTKLAATLEKKADELASLLDQLAPQARATQAELGNKLAEIESGADTHRRCADFLYGLYRLAGLDFHADRLRQK